MVLSTPTIIIFMKFAFVAGQRQEAQPGLSGECQGCGGPMIAKCGEVRIWHWAHQTKHACDVWWENETERHRKWKDQFPAHWQEFPFRADDGERHIADVRTDHEWVIELQHSYIKPDERRSRDAFYKKLVWVVDATRRKTDADQFRKALESGTRVFPFMWQVRLDECRLLREWSGSPGFIFFDFGPGPALWALLARRPDEPAYVVIFQRDDFIATHHGKGTGGALDFDEFARVISETVASYNAQLRSRALAPPPMQATGFQHYLARRNSRRRL